jgi:superfamily II DNA or RNA helicase
VQLRPYQSEAVDWLAPRSRGFVVAPAGSGKTIIAAAAAKQALSPGARAVWLCGTKEQKDQAEAALRQVAPDVAHWQISCVAGFDLCMLHNRPSLLVLDEAHHQPAATWRAAVASFLAANARVWGFSATPWHDRDTERNDLLKETFEDFFIIEREDVERSGHLLPGIVRLVDIDSTREFEKELQPKLEAEVARRSRIFRRVPAAEHRRRAQWQLTLEHLQQDMRRNAAIVNLARSEMLQGETVIVLVSTIEHGEELALQIQDSAVLHAQLPTKLRRERVEALRSGVLRCVVATSLLDEGADFPRASVLILATAGRSSTKTIQRAGRVMRPHAGKTAGVVYDFVDRGLVFAYAQHKARLKTYQQLEYKIEDGELQN